MNILLDNLIFSWQKSGGVSVFWENILKLALRLNQTHHIELIEYPNAEDNIVRKTLDLSSLSTNVLCPFSFKWHRYQHLDWKAAKTPFIFHSSYYRVCTNPQAINIVTVHDFTYEHFISGPQKWLHTWQKRRSLRAADAIVCVSQNTCNDLLHFFPEIPEQKIHIIHNGVDKSYIPKNNSEPESTRKKLQLPKQYLLFVGNRASYKQFPYAAKLAKAVNLPLVIVGAPLSKQERQLLGNLQVVYQERNFVANHELQAYYSLATALVYPSLYEGFGIPVIEAQRCGCPVIAYNASSIPEVIGEDYPLLLPELDVSVASNWINQLLTDQSFRNSIITQGIENSLRFSWDKMQESYQALYTQLWAEHTSQTK